MKGNKYLFGMILAFVFIFFIIGASTATLESYGSKKVNSNMTFCQVCADASYITLSSIETPTSTIQIDKNMTVVGTSQFCYNYTPIEIGRYDFKGISDGCDKTFATFMEVTPSGFTGTIGFFLVILLILGALITLGFTIKDGWFVIFGGLGLIGFGLYSIINGIADLKDPLVTWGTSITLIGVGAYLSINSAIQMIDEGFE